MNSKEALNNLFEITRCEGCSRECYVYEDEREDCIQWHMIIKQDLERLEKLEKELKQTKLNFKNSQIHSKNCYKKLKKKYDKLKHVLDDNEGLINGNCVMNDIIEGLECENESLKKTIDILKDQLQLEKNILVNLDKTVEYNLRFGVYHSKYSVNLTQEEYEQLMGI